MEMDLVKLGQEIVNCIPLGIVTTSTFSFSEDDALYISKHI
jgi:hypothetical protein